jgi:hypothetical protein
MMLPQRLLSYRTIWKSGFRYQSGIVASAQRAIQSQVNTEVAVIYAVEVI